MKASGKYLSLLGLLLAMIFMSSIAVHADVANCSQYHTVARGDGLYTIAKRYGTTISNLQAINSLPNVNLIYVGQKLCVSQGVVQPNPQPNPIPVGDPTGRVTAFLLNVRSGPGVQYPVLRLARRNAILQLGGITPDGKWLMVMNSPTNSTEWVSSSYVQVDKINAIPVVQGTDPISPIDAGVVLGTPMYWGPGINYGPTGGWLAVDQIIGIIGKNASTSWFQIQNGAWVPASTFTDSVKLYTFPVTG